MKPYTTTLLLITLLFSTLGFSQRATVTATNYDISDNLDLQAVASIFGDSKDLSDFERRLNDPSIQISNLDLNRDNYVDYLRVIEVVEGRTHLIVIQSVLGQDLFQDVATIEVEKDRRNRIQVQIVGNEFIYGHNYIYEPIYVSTPILFNTFWTSTYRPYYSSWYWNYYPTYYSAWEPYPIFRYRNQINIYINTNNRYVYSNERRSSRSQRLYNDVRSNSYEREYPNRSFTQRNANVSNRYILDQNRVSSSSRIQPSGNVDTSNRGSDVNENYRRSTSVGTDNSSRSVNSSSSRQSSSSRIDNSSRSVNSSSTRPSSSSRIDNSSRSVNSNSSRPSSTRIDNSSRSVNSNSSRPSSTRIDNSSRSVNSNSSRPSSSSTRIDNSSRSVNSNSSRPSSTRIDNSSRSINSNSSRPSSSRIDNSSRSINSGSSSRNSSVQRDMPARTQSYSQPSRIERSAPSSSSNIGNSSSSRATSSGVRSESSSSRVNNSGRR